MYVCRCRGQGWGWRWGDGDGDGDGDGMKYLTGRLGGGGLRAGHHGGGRCSFFSSFFSPGCMRLHAGRRSVCVRLSVCCLSAVCPRFSIFYSPSSILHPHSLFCRCSLRLIEMLDVIWPLLSSIGRLVGAGGRLSLIAAGGRPMSLVLGNRAVDSVILSFSRAFFLPFSGARGRVFLSRRECWSGLEGKEWVFLAHPPWHLTRCHKQCDCVMTWAFYSM